MSIAGTTGSAITSSPMDLYPFFERIDVKNAQQARELIEQQNIQYIKLGIFDINGVLRGKYISRNKFLSGLEKGLGFCDVIIGADIDDQLCDHLKQTGWHTGYPDVHIEIIAESCRQIPFESNTLFFLAEFADKAYSLCSRNILKKIVNKASAMGFVPYAAMEYEFTVFQETCDSVRTKDYIDLSSITPGNFGYSILRNSVHSEFYHEFLKSCDIMNFPLEGLHTEIGPGVLEAAITYDQALQSGDKAALFKTMAKVFIQRYGWIATFMAKWDINQQGQSGHTHVSLRNKNDDCIFFDNKQNYNKSKTMQHFLAGQQKYMPDLLAMVAPTINSYARLVPGFWAPTQSSWGFDNRTCALRVIGGHPNSQRIEYRTPGADSNPYLAIAAALASGLWGIEQKLELTKPIEGNAYEQPLPQQYQLPRNLQEASERLRNCKLARNDFGSQFIDDYTATRDWEVRESQKQVTNWQLQRYFELI